MKALMALSRCHFSVSVSICGSDLLGQPTPEARPKPVSSPPSAATRAFPMDSIRQSKVNSLMVQELAAIFLEEGRNLFPGGLITVTGVRVSPDLGIAKTYLSLFPTKESKAVLDHIKEHAFQLRGKLGHRIGKQVRVVPELHFYLDDSLDRTEEIERLLKK
jgi:ribosome-binding factor A